jgi:drug/metabolite transporter (DMT)-like permease
MDRAGDERMGIALGHASGRRRAAGVAMLIAASIGWSISGVFVKLVDTHPLSFALWRSASAAVFLAALLPLVPGTRPRGRWMGLSILLYTAVVALLIAAMTYATAAKGILLQYIGPIACAVFAWIFQRRVIARRSVLAIAVASLGVGIMVIFGRGEAGPLGTICGIASGICFGGLILLLEKVDRDEGGRANPVWIVFANNAGSALLLLPVCLAAGAIELAAWKVAAMCFVGVVQLAIPYLLFQLGLRRVHPVDASLLVLLEPVLNPIWVALLTTERPDAATIAGGVAILAAMVIEASKPKAEVDRET